VAQEAVVDVAEVKGFRTRSGNTRYVLRDADGGEYSTFREQIARSALAAEGRRARIRFHETERNGFTNVYLDSVEALALALGLEREFDLAIPDEDLTVELFANLATLADYVRRALAASGRG